MFESAVIKALAESMTVSVVVSVMSIPLTVKISNGICQYPCITSVSNEGKGHLVVVICSPVSSI